jgi:hypothetical protein
MLYCNTNNIFEKSQNLRPKLIIEDHYEINTRNYVRNNHNDDDINTMINRPTRQKQ